MLKSVIIALFVCSSPFTSAFGQDIAPSDLTANWVIPNDEIHEFAADDIPFTARNFRAEQSWSVADLVADDRCSAPLRATIFTEVYRKQSRIAKAASMK